MDVLEAARRNEAIISQQLDSQSTKYVSDRLKLLKELDELKQRNVLEEAESDSKIQQTAKEFSSQAQLTEARYAEAIEKEKDKLETISRENEQLKRVIGEHREASAGLSSLHSQLERHVQQLAAQTETLRSDLERAQGSPVQRSGSPGNNLDASTSAAVLLPAFSALANGNVRSNTRVRYS